MTNPSEFSHDRPQDDLPQPYRTAVDAILAEPIPDIDLEHLISCQPMPATFVSNRRRPKPAFLRTMNDMPWIFKSVTAVGLAAALLVLYLVFSSPAGSSIALAQVVEKFVTAHSVSHDLIVESVAHTYPVTKSRMTCLEPDKTRVETVDPATGEIVAVLVSDQAVGTTLLMSPKAKTAFVGKIGGADQSGPQDSFLSHFRALAKKASRSLGQKTVDGVESVGFEIDQGNYKIRVWADAKTGAPVRIESDDFPLPPPFGRSKTVINNFKFDEKIDPEIFNVEPPKDYSVIKSPIDIDLSVTPAHLATTILRIYAQRTDGQFPAHLDDQGESIFKELKKLGVKVNEQGEEAEMTRFRAWIMQLNDFFNERYPGKDFAYYPGAKLGEKDRLVFWYKDKKSGEYKAIYGDLRVEKVDKEKLPPPENDGNK